MIALTVCILAISAFTEALESVGKVDVQPYEYKTKWFTQRIDHYGLSQNGFFKQRFLVNDTWWDARENGPIFFYAGNEGDIEAFAQNSGFMWDIAPHFRAMLVFAEHRYYGKSLPFGDKSVKVNEIANKREIISHPLQPDPKYNGYLTSEQALADYAALLTHLKATIAGASKSPVIAFGGSYGGMLAAWFRIKFPHICDGAVAASAPVNQFDAPCEAFGRIVTADYAAEGGDCVEIIRRSWVAVDNVTASANGLKWLQDEFELCDTLKKEDVPAFKAYLNNLWTNVAMMDYPYPTTFLMPLPGNPVRAVCKKIQLAAEANMDDVFASNKSLLSAAFAGVQVYFNYTGSAKCLKLADPDEIGSSMWDYQACTEMVMPMCFDNVQDMFEKTPWNYTAYAEGCKQRWKVEPRPLMADTMYGGKKLQAASNIIFT